MKPEPPPFVKWSHESLVKFATDAYHRMRQDAETIEQLRQDFKDAMNLVRKTTYNQDDWK